MAWFQKQDDGEEKQVSSDHAYLEKLEFRPELRKTWLNFFVSNFRVVVLLIALLTALGLFSFFSLPRESNPEVKIPIAVVTAVYPGASPTDVEELVTKKLETQISGVRGVNKITSNSSNSFSAITVEFEASENVDDAIRRLTDKVNQTKTELPTEVQTPVVREISFDDSPIMTVAFTGDLSPAGLKDYVDKIKDELEKIPGVREINVSGGDENEFEIAYDPQKLLFFSITADQANQMIKAVNVGIPSGIFDGSSFTYPVRTDARFYDAEALGNIPVSHGDDGSIVFLKDVATVREKAIKKTVYSRISTNGEMPRDAVTLDIVKKTGGSILDTVNASKKVVTKMVAASSDKINFEITSNTGDRIEEDFDQLSHDFLLTLLLVFGMLFLLVGFKEALVAGLAVPLTLFATFGVMLATGITLNFLSIFSLLLALGLLVDDAIVVVSATKQYLRTGKFTPEEAVLLVLNDFKIVLLTTTLTTVWAFLPLLFATGIIGQFIKSIPITVSVALISSLIIALVVNHPLAAVLERIRLTRKFFFLYIILLFSLALFSIVSFSFVGYLVGTLSIISIFFMLRWYEKIGKQKLVENKVKMDAEWEDDELIKQKLRDQYSHEKEDQTFGSKLIHGLIHLDMVMPFYEKYLRKLITTKRNRLLTLAVTFGVFVIAVLMPVTGLLPTEFFPNDDFQNVYVTVEAPIGMKLDDTNKLVEKTEEQLLQYKEIKDFSTLVGSANGASGRSLQDTSNIGSITLTLVDKKDRKIKSYDFAEKLRKEIKVDGAKITVDIPRGGPPSGAAFEARISGDDKAVLEKIAHDLEKKLVEIPGVVNANISVKDAPAEYTFVLDPILLERNNLNAAYVGAALRMAISGVNVTTVLRNGKEINVVANFDEAKIPDLEALQNLQILNLRKQPVFLKDVAKIELKPAVETYTRVDQKGTVLLSSGVSSTARPNEIVAEFQKRIEKEYQLPPGYSIAYGGENEQNTESVLSIIKAMAVAALLIITTLVVQFNSFKKMAVVLVTIPLALIGTFIGMTIFRVPLSFPGLIGILALFGIVVKNAIILIDKINLNIKSGIPFEESIIDAGKSRLEAIFITSICTILGIIPITLSSATWKALGSAIIFGLSISSFFTLFIVPILFMTLIKKEERF